MSLRNPIQNYVPILCWGPSGEAEITTLQSSWAAATPFSPCSYLVNHLTLQVESEKAAKAVQGLQYLAKPIDAVIQAIAMPVFAAIDHIRDLGKGSLLDMGVKILLTPISLPLKLFLSLLVSAGYLFNGVSQLIIPYSMIFGIAKGKEAAFRYFYEISEINNKFQHKQFLKPIQILPLKYHDDLNPFCKHRNALFLSIDPKYRDFNQDNLGAGTAAEKWSDSVGKSQAEAIYRQIEKISECNSVLSINNGLPIMCTVDM